MNSNAQPVVNNFPTQTAGSEQMSTPQKTGNKTTFFIVILVLLFIVFLLAVVSETIYLSKNDYQRCNLLRCEAIIPTEIPFQTPQKLSLQKIDAITTWLGNFASPEIKESSFFQQFKFTLMVQGIVQNVAPEVAEVNGQKTVFRFTIVQSIGEPGKVMKFTFTEDELKRTKVTVFVYSSEKVYNATINDIKQGDTVVVSMTHDLIDNGSPNTISNGLLDTSGNDSINIEIRRQSF